MITGKGFDQRPTKIEWHRKSKMPSQVFALHIVRKGLRKYMKSKFRSKRNSLQILGFSSVAVSLPIKSDNPLLHKEINITQQHFMSMEMSITKLNDTQFLQTEKKTNLITTPNECY